MLGVEQVPVLNMVGTHSAHVDETIVLNGKLNPETSEWMNVMVQDTVFAHSTQLGLISNTNVYQGLNLSKSSKVIIFGSLLGGSVFS